MLIAIIISLILGSLLLIMGEITWSKWGDYVVPIGAVLLILSIFLMFLGLFTGFVYHPATEGTHIGVITAVDLEGIWFRRYEIYLKSGGYSKGTNDTVPSDETIYKIYENEKELANKLKEAIGKTVKIYYGHDGGYIGWKSCGTYHIKNVEIVEE